MPFMEHICKICKYSIQNNDLWPEYCPKCESKMIHVFPLPLEKINLKIEIKEEKK